MPSLIEVYYKVYSTANGPNIRIKLIHDETKTPQNATTPNQTTHVLQTLKDRNTLHQHQHAGCAEVSETPPNKAPFFLFSAKPTSHNLQIIVPI